MKFYIKLLSPTFFFLFVCLNSYGISYPSTSYSNTEENTEYYETTANTTTLGSTNWGVYDPSDNTNWSNINGGTYPDPILSNHGAGFSINDIINIGGTDYTLIVNTVLDPLDNTVYSQYLMAVTDVNDPGTVYGGGTPGYFLLPLNDNCIVLTILLAIYATYILIKTRKKRVSI
jgi:hypothetical protein